MNSTFADLPPTAPHLIDTAIASFHRLPGSAIALRYTTPSRSLVELFLFIFAVRYLLAPAYSTSMRKNVPLTKDEIDELVDDCTPEPLTSEETTFGVPRMRNDLSSLGQRVRRRRKLASSGRMMTNLGSYNHFNFAAKPELNDKGISTIRTYGVGRVVRLAFTGRRMCI
ncbi:serine palmitoyltransferase component [Elasticomyces elasticus]|nr:serine palmitoyltransferase component [Elasticomyces elasticus]